MEKSETLELLAAALAVVQSEIAGAKKDRVNPHYGSRYPDLSSVWAACRAALTANGLSVVQTFEAAAPDCLALRTTLLHTSGQWISGLCLMPLAKQDPQGYGSAATYARRYGLAAIVGVCPEDDDDANAASGLNGGSYQLPQLPRANGNGGPATCTCHAPPGKPHGTRCPLRGTLCVAAASTPDPTDDPFEDE